MSRRAFKVLVEVKFRAVSCPGVHLPAKDDIYLSVSFLDQYHQSEHLPAVFPLLLHEKMTFEKIFRFALDPGDVAVMLQYETIRIELVQAFPPVGDTLAFFEEDARSFLFPEPKLVRPFSGVDREVLMIRAPHFPGIAPRLEFSTKTTITECSPGAEVNIHPNRLLRPVLRRNRRGPSRVHSTPPQKKSPQSHRGRRGGGTDRERLNKPLSHIPRSQSLSPRRHGNIQLQDPAASWETHTSQPMLASWPGASPSDSPHRSASFSSSPLTRSSSSVGRPSTSRRQASSHRLGAPEGPVSSALRPSYREHPRSECSSHTAWEEVHERVRGLLTTPRAVCRLVCGATDSEVNEVLGRGWSVPSSPP